jgi:hypothetical protein
MLGTWVAPGEDIRKMRPMRGACREMRTACLRSVLATWDMREPGAAAMPLGGRPGDPDGARDSRSSRHAEARGLPMRVGRVPGTRCVLR